jgi:hypothetical protein
MLSTGYNRGFCSPPGRSSFLLPLSSFWQEYRLSPASKRSLDVIACTNCWEIAAEPDPDSFLFFARADERGVYLRVFQDEPDGDLDPALNRGAIELGGNETPAFAYSPAGRFIEQGRAGRLGHFDDIHTAIFPHVHP